MAIYKGNTKQNIHKGVNKIANVYKGTILVYSAGYWLSYGFTYLYNSLVPTTIDSKSVKNKARIKKIYANGVIENQLVKDSIHTSQTHVTIEKLEANDYFTISITSEFTGTFVTPLLTSSVIANHKYFIKFSGAGTLPRLGLYYYTLTNNPIALGDLTTSTFLTATKSGLYLAVQNPNAVSGNGTFKLQIFDLTQMFGTGNEPTALTDNRIQKILNSGYIEPNAGTYKGTDISEFSSEPYNLFDEELEQGWINNQTGEYTSSRRAIRFKNLIKVIGGKSYTLEANNFTFTTYRIYQYDKDKNFIGTIYSSSMVFQLSQETCYISYATGQTGVVPTNPQVCFHITGTRTGYAPHQSFSPLSFIYQGNGALNSHDTLEITNSEWVFTKNTNKVDIGSLIYLSLIHI